MFLNFGIKHKYQAAVDALIETLTDLRALHIGNKATYLLNQREGLKGMCLKTSKGALYNLSEHLNYAFFWPQNAPEELELKNVGEKHYAMFKTKDISIANDSKDLAAVFYHKYRENLPTTPATYTSEMNSRFLTRYAATKSVPESSNAWKFDHWEQFINTEWDKIEFCFRPVFKLDRVNEYWHMCPVLSDQTHSSTGYTDNPNRNMNVNGYHNSHQPGYADTSTYVTRLYANDPAYRITYLYRGSTRQENFDQSALSRGVIPTVDYYQDTTQLNWKVTRINSIWDYGYGIMVHGCSHQLDVGDYYIGDITNVWTDYWGHKHSYWSYSYTPVLYSGKKAGVTLPSISEPQTDPHEASAVKKIFARDVSTIRNDSAGIFEIQQDEELLDRGVSYQELLDIFEFKTGEVPVYFEIEIEPGHWITFYNDDVAHGMEIEFREPDPILTRRTYYDKFDIKGTIQEVSYTVEEEGYMFNADSYMKDAENGKIMLINGASENITLMSLSDTGAFSYKNKNNETILTSASSSELDNDLYNKCSSVFAKENDFFYTDDGYRNYPYIDEIIDENAANKHHYIKISDTHYKVPNALVKRYKAGSKDHHTDDYYITP